MIELLDVRVTQPLHSAQDWGFHIWSR